MLITEKAQVVIKKHRLTYNKIVTVSPKKGGRKNSRISICVFSMCPLPCMISMCMKSKC